jgi:hypothetical protein
MTDADKELVDRLRKEADINANYDGIAYQILTRTANRIEAQAEEIERLRKAGQKLNDYACHDDDCQIVTHGVWSDPIPCTCGYEDAWKAWAALGETK